ncbi:unnamed protein product [Caenorhabditis auriculariae]|uniref:Uncharacterized protein n=1 Tax=Caenorhabditis auriculariae TaxID=2777116 RepID=A0A8S1HGT3_9PELO|nr:unnamed protein product [Caenorhabditis auriculariae]
MKHSSFKKYFVFEREAESSAPNNALCLVWPLHKGRSFNSYREKPERCNFWEQNSLHGFADLVLGPPTSSNGRFIFTSSDFKLLLCR